MEQVSPILSIETIKQNEYNRYGEMYRPLITGEKYEHKISYVEKTIDILGDLPKSDKQRVEDFTSRVSSFIPDTIFSSYHNAPTNKEGLRALVAHAYRVDDGAHQDSNTREMYIRALSALSGDNFSFVNGGNESTEEAIDAYFNRDYSIDSFVNCLAQACTASMPTATVIEKNREMNKTSYDAFFDRQRQRYQKAMTVLIDCVDQYFPDKSAIVSEWTNNLVFVEDISRIKVLTNDEQLSAEVNYNNLSAGAVAFGVDHICGLPMTVTCKPYNYDEIAKKTYIEPRRDPTYTETLTLIHENIHNVQPERDFSGDYMNLINELLTDSSAWIITLRSEGQDFVTCSDEYLANTGYVDLVLFARNLVKNGFVTSDELVNFGLRQDPESFLSLLSDKVKQCADGSKIDDVVNFLEKQMVIRPRKGIEQANLTSRFKSDPIHFLEIECMEMWDLCGSQYFGQKMFMITVFDLFRERHPEVGEYEYRAIRNPDGMFSDEIVDIIQNEAKPRKRHPGKFLQTEIVDELLIQNEPWLTHTDTNIPEQLKVGPDEIITKRKLIDYTNVILYAGLDYHVSGWNDSQRLNAIILASQQLYTRSIAILEHNWRDNGIPYGKEEVLKIMGDLAPQWLTWQSKVAEPIQVIEKVLDGVDAMTRPTITPDGEQVFGPDQLFYWGPALEINSNR